MMVLKVEIGEFMFYRVIFGIYLLFNVVLSLYISNVFPVIIGLILVGIIYFWPRKVLVLKTVSSDMKAYGGFKWPTSGKVKCPDWNPDPVCGGGFHGLLWGEGNYWHLKQEDDSRKWLVLEVDKDKLVDFDGKVKFEECEVIYCGDREGSCEVILERNPEACCPGAGKEYCFEDKRGYEFWYLDGFLYKERMAFGNTIYYKEGRKHREDGPAIEYADGTKFWYKEDKLHRLDGSAIEWADGGKDWYKDGKCHRLDGPAIEFADGYKDYWIEGKRLTEEEFDERVSKESLK